MAGKGHRERPSREAAPRRRASLSWGRETYPEREPGTCPGDLCCAEQSR